MDCSFVQSPWLALCGSISIVLLDSIPISHFLGCRANRLCRDTDSCCHCCSRLSHYMYDTWCREASEVCVSIAVGRIVILHGSSSFASRQKSRGSVVSTGTGTW